MMIRVTRCSDPLMWYANLVGKLVPWTGRVWPGDGYACREPAGYLNVVRFIDGTPA